MQSIQTRAPKDLKFKDKILYNLIQSIYKLSLYLWNQIKEAIEIKGFFFPFISGKALLGLLLQQRGQKTNSSFPCSLAHSPSGKRVGVARFFLICGEGMGVSRAGGLAEVAPPVALSVGGIPSTQLLLPTSCFCSRLFKSGSWDFGLFVSFVQNLPQLCMPPAGGIFIESRIKAIKP